MLIGEGIINGIYPSLLTSWFDIYPGVQPPINEKQRFENKQFVGKTIEIREPLSIWINNCFFHDLTKNAIILNSVSYFLVEYSTFYNCHIEYSSGSGISRHGAVINSKECDFVMLSYICVSNCSGSEESFSDLYVKQDNSIERTISIVGSSVTYGDTASYYTLYIQHGFNFIKSLNLSENKAKEYSGFAISPNQKNEEGYGVVVEFSTFHNNTADNDCLKFGSTGVNVHLMKYSNILSNNGNYSISGSSSTKLLLCTISENDTPVFYGRVVLYNCSIEKEQISGDVDASNAGQDSFFNTFSYIITGDCRLEWFVGMKDVGSKEKSKNMIYYVWNFVIVGIVNY